MSQPEISISITAVDTASQVLDQVDNKVMQTAAQIEAEGQKTASTTQRIAESLKKNWQQVAQNTAILGANVVGFATSFNTLQRTQLNADKANLTYQRSLEHLTQLQKSGTASSKDLADAQEQVRINSEKLALEQDHVHDVYSNFLANVPGQFMSFASSTIGILRTAGVIQDGVSAKSAILSAAHFVLARIENMTTGSTVQLTGALASMSAGQSSSAVASLQLTGALAGMTAGTSAATGAMGVLRTAMTLLAAHPLVLVLMGVATVITLLIFNVGGLRDMFVSAGRVVLDFIDAHLKPLGDIIHAVIGAFQWLSDSVSGANSAQKAYADSADSTGDSVTKTSEKIQTYEQYLQQAASETMHATEQNFFYIQSHDELLASTLSSADGINQVAEYMRKQATDADNARAANFALIATHYDLQTALALSDDQLADFADALRQQEELQKDASDAADKEKEAQERATDQIKERIDANVDLAKSMGVTIDLTRTTVSETDRIADHLRDLQSDYENSRKRVEDFAIAHGVNVVDAVKASDDELLTMINTLGGVDNKTYDTRKRIVDDFNASRDAVKDYAQQTGVNSQLAGKFFTDYTSKAIDDNLALQKSLQKSIDYYEDLASAARHAEAARNSSSGNAGLGGFAKGSSQNPFGFASGGIIDEFIYGVGASGKTYTFGEKGKEVIIPLDDFDTSNAANNLIQKTNNYFGNSSERFSETSQFDNGHIEAVIRDREVALRQSPRTSKNKDKPRVKRKLNVQLKIDGRECGMLKIDDVDALFEKGERRYNVKVADSAWPKFSSGNLY